MSMTEWVPVMAPPELAPRFLREVAEHIASGASAADARLWDNATGRDVAEFVGLLNTEQHRLLVSLAFSETPASTATHAERIGVTVENIAGYVGPINKRAKKLGWISPIRSHNFWTGKRTEKVLVLDDRLALWVRDHHEEDHQ